MFKITNDGFTNPQTAQDLNRDVQKNPEHSPVPLPIRAESPLTVPLTDRLCTFEPRRLGCRMPRIRPRPACLEHRAEPLLFSAIAQDLQQSIPNLALQVGTLTLPNHAAPRQVLVLNFLSSTDSDESSIAPSARPTPFSMNTSSVSSPLPQPSPQAFAARPLPILEDECEELPGESEFIEGYEEPPSGSINAQNQTLNPIPVTRHPSQTDLLLRPGTPDFLITARLDMHDEADDVVLVEEARPGTPDFLFPARPDAHAEDDDVVRVE